MAPLSPFIGSSAVGDAVAAVEAIVAAPDLTPADRERLHRVIVSLERRLRDGAFSETPRLLIHDDMRWFEVPGSARVSLQRRGPVRLLFRTLVEQHRRAPGRASSLSDLLNAGWPGQRVTHASGAARVYVALATLRRLGLRPLLQTRDDGYLLDPSLVIVPLQT